MKNYDTIIDALQGLKKRGYTHDFNLHPDGSKCVSGDIHLHPEDFEIKEIYRFEGMSNPDDNSVVYAIESKEGIKGVLVDAYGIYAEAMTPEMAIKLGKK